MPVLPLHLTHHLLLLLTVGGPSQLPPLLQHATMIAANRVQKIARAMFRFQLLINLDPPTISMCWACPSKLTESIPRYSRTRTNVSWQYIIPIGTTL